MFIRIRILPAALAILAVACIPRLASAQATGTIAGTIVDQTDLPIPGVEIVVRSRDTDAARRAVSQVDGGYTVPLLQPGTYTVTASMQSFRRAVRENVVVVVASTTRMDFQLAVEVTTVMLATDGAAALPVVDTTSTQLGLVVDAKKIEDLPLNGRNFTQLGTLLPGVIAPPSALGGAAGDATPGGFGAATAGFNVNGMRNQSNNFLLDGVSNNDTFNTGFVMRPPPDAIQEFKILAHSFNAEYGRNAGAVVNVVTRSGSNNPTGALWLFDRDDALQARNFFAPATQPKPKLQQQQFGGSAGGPLVASRLFAFGYYDGYRNTTGETLNLTVPSDAQRRGDFGSTRIVDPRTGAPFASNVIPPDRIDAAARDLVAAFYPAPNTGIDRYVASPDTTDDRDQMGVRLDVRTAQHSFLGRYQRARTERTTPASTRPIGTEARATLQDVMLSHSYVVSPNAVNQARLAYNRISANPAATSGQLNADFGIDVPHNVSSATGLANITVTGFPALGDLAQPFVERLNDVWQFTDDFAWVKGRQSFQFGVDVRREHMVIAFVNRPNGDFTFSGVHTGHALADFLLGLPAQFRRTTSNTIQDGSGWSYAAYAQAQFRIRSTLTLNTGIRYELSQPFVDENDALNAFRPGVQSQRFPQAPAGLVYPGDPGIPRGTYETDTNNLAPRVGVAWDPGGEGRSSFRAAWGLFYDALAGQGDFFQNGVLAPPFTPLLEVNAPPAALSLRTPLASVSGGAPGFPPGLTFIGWGADFTTPYAHHFNTSWQQQIGERTAVEIGYLGSRGKHLPIFMEVNPGLYTPGQTTRGARLFPAFALVRPTFSVAESWFDSLQASLRVNPTRALHALASYTLGRARDHVSGLNVGGELRPALPVTIGDEASIARSLDNLKGPAQFDARHRIVVSFTADVPSPVVKHALLKQVASGWQVNGIVQWQTGFPLTVSDSIESIRYLTNRPNQICDPNANAPRTPERWFDTSCFQRRALADTAEPGSTPRNSVRGPGLARTDLSLFKNIELPHGQRVQLRLEAFNIWNQVRFGNPNTTIGNVNFGRITTADDGRVLQLGVKYRF
jgi:hypothetical protein